MECPPEGSFEFWDEDQTTRVVEMRRLVPTVYKGRIPPYVELTGDLRSRMHLHTHTYTPAHTHIHLLLYTMCAYDLLKPNTCASTFVRACTCYEGSKHAHLHTLNLSQSPSQKTDNFTPTTQPCACVSPHQIASVLGRDEQ